MTAKTARKSGSTLSALASWCLLSRQGSEMVTDCNDDGGNDEDVGVGWDEECFFMSTAIPSRQSGFSRGEPPASL